MSIRFDSNSDALQIVNGATTLTLSGDFSMGMWVKLMTDADAPVEIIRLAQGLDTSMQPGWETASDGTGLEMIYGGGTNNLVYAASTSTWYYLVLSRSGTTVRGRVFDDTTSTTPLDEATDTDGAPTDYTGRDSILIGNNAGSRNAANMEVESLKIHTGVAWSDAECRTESQNYTIQKSGGTDRLAWKFTNTDADTDGINEVGGSGPNFTATTVAAGASTPSQLAPAGTTLYFLDSTASGSNFGQLQFGGSAPSTATTATGWTVDTVGSSNYALMAYGSERLSSTFSGTAQPAGNPDNSLGDCFRSTSTLSGDFATGVWTIAIPVIAVSAAAGQDGRVRVRLWKSANATGTSPTEITSGAVAGTTVTNLTTGAEQVSTVTTGSITGFSLANEYLFVQVAWEITGAAT